MRTYSARVSEIRLQGPLQGPDSASAWIACPPSAIPAPGRYVLAWAPDDADAPLATTLFASDRDASHRLEPPSADSGFLAAPPLPRAWVPGTGLILRGPLGRGFSWPAPLRKLALAALGDTVARLIPLLDAALTADASVALFASGPLPSLPPAVEVNPLDVLPDAPAWADFLALDVPLESLPSLGRLLRMEVGDTHLACPAQVLIYTAMPCGGLSDCGVCALPVRRGWKLVCKDGPVFEVHELLP